MELSNIFGDPGASRVSFLTTMGKSSDMEEVTENMHCLLYTSDAADE